MRPGDRSREGHFPQAQLCYPFRPYTVPVQPGALAQKTPSSEAPSSGFGGAGRSLAFLGRAALWVVLLFGITRIPWVQQHLLLPFAAFQGRIGGGLFMEVLAPHPTHSLGPKPIYLISQI